MPDYVEAAENEFGYYFQFTIYEDYDTVYAMDDDETITLRITLPGGTAQAVGTGTIQNATNGIVRIAISSTDAGNIPEGLHDAQIQISTSSKMIVTQPFKINFQRAI